MDYNIETAGSLTDGDSGRLSTLGLDGVAKLAPYSFSNIVSERPPTLLFSSDGQKDTVRNIEASREFVINLATSDLAGP